MFEGSRFTICDGAGLTIETITAADGGTPYRSFAALEVIHVLLGWVRSPLVTTLIQVASRLYLIWGIADQFPQVRPVLRHATNLSLVPLLPPYSHPCHVVPDLAPSL